MLSIVIYSDQYDDVEKLKSIIQDFLTDVRIIAKVLCFNDPKIFIAIPNSYDIYIMDMDSKDDTLELGRKIKNINSSSYFIYISSDPSNAVLAAKARVNYYLLKPLEHDEIIEVLKEIKKKIKDDNIIIKIPGGERRIQANHLNYINIVKRCLCYHLSDGNVFEGQNLRTSFKKAIDPLQNHKTFLFIPPSLLINIGAIKIINKDNIIFENDEVLFLPMKQYENVHNAWINYNRIFD